MRLFEAGVAHYAHSVVRLLKTAPILIAHTGHVRSLAPALIGPAFCPACAQPACRWSGSAARSRAHKMMDSRALRTFLPETAIKMVKSCHPRGGAREAGAADGVEIAPNVVHAQHGPAGDLMLGLASRLFIRRNGACGQIPLGSAAASL